MSYLGVLGEAIGHACTLRALLELGTRTRGSSWDLGAGRASKEGRQWQSLGEKAQPP